MRILSLLVLPALLLSPASTTPNPASQAPAASPTHALMVEMRDGVKLATDVYLPEGAGPFPAIVARTPYNKDFARGLAPQVTSRGFAFVAQDSRGRHKSEGRNLAYDADGWAEGREDGYDTIEWAAKQSWCDGKVGTWGGSALGIAQYLLAGTAPPSLLAQHVTVGAPSFYRDIIYRGGAFKKNLIEEWLKSQKYEETQLKTWRDHPNEDGYWLDRDLSSRWSKANAAAVHMGGWYDIFAQGTIDAFVGYQTRGGKRARGSQRLVMGPWAHGVGQRKVGEITFPENATAPLASFGDLWAWYDFWLKGKDNGVDKEQPVAYYVMGDTTDSGSPGNTWRFTSSWPPPSTPTPYYLMGDRSLSTAPPAPDRNIPPFGYLFDPLQPVPTVGGNHLTLPSGPLDQREIEKRGDVLVFTSAELDKPVEVTGRVKMKLWISSDAPDTDFTAKLCDVYPDGRSLNVCDGIIRARFRRSFRTPRLLKRGEVYPIEMDLWSTSMVFNKGHRLRVQISSSSYPAYEPNPNTGEGLLEDADAPTEPRVAHNFIYADAKHPSHILLPVMSSNGSTK
jgi:uncharacterized protein